MANDIFILDENDNAAIRTVVVSGISESNKKDIFTTDENGNAAVRVVGSGGGDKHNMGYFTTPEALATAYPTAEAGDFAIVGSTDTVWVWDVESSAWVDTDTKGQVTPDMVIIKSATLPAASSVVPGSCYFYSGATNANYTHGYVYECQGTNTYADTTTFQPATLSGTVVTATSNALSGLVSQYIHADITSIVSGTMTFDQAGNLWVFYGYDSDHNEVGHFQLYQEDWESAGFTFTGTPQDGDVVALSTTITIASTSYAWVRINVQPQPTPAEIGAATQSQVTVTLAAADWSGNSQIKTVTGVKPNNTVVVAPAPSSSSDYSAAGILCTAQSINQLTFSCDTTPSNNISVNVLILD